VDLLAMLNIIDSFQGLFRRSQNPPPDPPPPRKMQNASSDTDPRTTPVEPTIYDPPSFITSAEDISRAFMTLTRHVKPPLPIELALTILDYADYVPHILTRAPRKVSVSASSGLARDGRRNINLRAIVCTPPVPTAARRVKEITFWTSSRDQGNSGESREVKGTYRCSWTWFEAMILRPVDGEVGGDTEVDEDIARQGYFDTTDENKEWPPRGYQLVEGGPWRVQTNINSSWTTREHVVRWHFREKEEEPVEIDELGYVIENGAGQGIGFVRALKPGDKVVLLARAIFPGWCNYVEGAMVDMVYATDTI